MKTQAYFDCPDLCVVIKPTTSVFILIFSVISNVEGTVSIKPMLNAKTYLNGNIVSECTVLHHVSDRMNRMNRPRFH